MPVPTNETKNLKIYKELGIRHRNVELWALNLAILKSKNWDDQIVSK